MTIFQDQQSTAGAQACDGAFGFHDGTYDYVVNGWTSGTTTLKKFWRSSDAGATFSALSDFTFPAHTMASTIVNGVPYIVGGDVFSPVNSGDYIRSSHKFVSGAWQQIAANCGIVDRCLAQLVYLDGAFYLLGGQRTTDPADGVYHTVMRSVDDCASFSVINSDTRLSGFKGGLNWGGYVVYQGLIWRIGGGIYDSTLKREYDTAIYSSPDGVTWTYRGEFPGVGRHYHQTLVHDGRIWVLGGYNPCYGGNIGTIVWTATLSGGRLVWTNAGSADFSARHALTCWSTPQGILLFGGTSNEQLEGDCWLIYEEELATPTFNVTEGIYASTQTVTISCATSGVSIYYTTDGTTPTSAGTLYSGPVAISTTAYLKAVAVKQYQKNSDVATVLVGIEPITVLDFTDNLWAVLSSRRLLLSYTGNLIKVRRSSDNALADIGSTGLEISTAALASHVGANNGFVHTAYDQTGNSRSLAQATTARQPQCVSSGTNVTGLFSNAVALSSRNGNGAGLFNNSLELPSAFTIAMRVKLDSVAPSFQLLFDAGGGGVVGIRHLGGVTDKMTGLVYVGGEKTAQATAGAIVIDTVYHVAITYDGANVLKLYVNGSLVATNSSTGAVSLSKLALEWMGFQGEASLEMQGDAQDLVILDAVADLTTIQALAEI